MDDRVFQFRVGAVVICGLLVTGILILFSGDIDWIFKRPYTVFLEPRTAPGVTKNTPVRKHGIRIGHVSDVETLDDGVRLTLRIDGDQKLYENELCKIGTASLLGDAVIDFIPGQSPNRGNQINNREMIRPERVLVEGNPVELISKVTELDFSKITESVAELPEAIAAVRDAGRSIENAGNNVAEFTESINRALGDEELDVGEIAGNIKEFSLEAREAVRNFNLVMSDIRAITGDEEFKEAMRESLKDAPEFMSEVKLAVSEVRETMDSFRQLAERADKNLENIEGLTEAIGERGPELIAQLETGFEGANQIIEQLNQFSRSLNNPNSTLGKLINDGTMYDDLSQTLANVRDISFKLKPIINDARYLMDGLARDPGQIVRGAFDRRPNSSGYKGTIGSGILR